MYSLQPRVRLTQDVGSPKDSSVQFYPHGSSCRRAVASVGVGAGRAEQVMNRASSKRARQRHASSPAAWDFGIKLQVINSVIIGCHASSTDKTYSNGGNALSHLDLGLPHLIWLSRKMCLS